MGFVASELDIGLVGLLGLGEGLFGAGVGCGEVGKRALLLLQAEHFDAAGVVLLAGFIEAVRC